MSTALGIATFAGAMNEPVLAFPVAFVYGVGRYLLAVSDG
jgi:hypothetical protein